MDAPSELDCKIYVETEREANELAALVARLVAGTDVNGTADRTFRSGYGEVEVRRNKEADPRLARVFPDGFLHFRYSLELYPFPTTRHEERVALVAAILKRLWSGGLPAVTACDYEQELPQGGGYNNPSVPWPSKEGDTVETVPG